MWIEMNYFFSGKCSNSHFVWRAVVDTFFFSRNNVLISASYVQLIFHWVDVQAQTITN